MTYKTKILDYIITCFDTLSTTDLMTSLSFSAPSASASEFAPEEKRFSFSKIIQPIRKIGQVAGKVADVAGKVAVVASIL
jgi:hypothetical protein